MLIQHLQMLARYNTLVDLLVAHFFNHQTHHRGQIHDMLTQTEIAPPVLDMHRVLRSQPAQICR